MSGQRRYLKEVYGRSGSRTGAPSGARQNASRTNSGGRRRAKRTRRTRGARSRTRTRRRRRRRR